MTTTELSDVETLSNNDESTIIVPVKIRLRPLFVNWHGETGDYPTADLLGETDLTAYDVILIDPLGYVLDLGLWKDKLDLSDKHYFGISYESFKRLLARLRKVAVALRKFLGNGGLLVLRSNIPGSYLRVKRKSKDGSNSLSDSIVFTFHWLEEFIGQCFFQKSSADTIKFADPEHPMARFLDGLSPSGWLTQCSIGKGKTEVVATTKKLKPAPAITFVSLAKYKGTILFVPPFEVKNESDLLLSALQELLNWRERLSDRPRWLSFFERQLEEYCPQNQVLKQVERDLEQLQCRRRTLVRQHSKFLKLTALITDCDRRNSEAVKLALESLGYEKIEPVNSRDMIVFRALAIECDPRRLRFTFLESPEEVIGLDQLEQFVVAQDLVGMSEHIKGVVIANSMASTEPENREQWFTPDCEEFARTHNICLIPSYELYLAVLEIAAHNESKQLDYIVKSLQSDIHRCDSVFHINRKKYGI